MKILSCEATNFGSYPKLSFDFDDSGLTLVHGPTGSGKSSLFDAVCWTLFGITAKNGSVDEVRNWKSESITSGEVLVDLEHTVIKVVRLRGKPSENDLYFIKDGATVRGKDVNDTQALINEALGVDKEVFLSSCYLNEFSPVHAFFTSSLKSRREILDIISDTSLPVRLFEKSKEREKSLSFRGVSLSKEEAVQSNIVNNLSSRIADLEQSSNKWEKDHELKTKELHLKSENFESIKETKLETLRTKSKVWDQNKELTLAGIDRKTQKLDDKLSKIEAAETELEALKAKAQEEYKQCELCGTVKADDKIENKKKALLLVIREKEYVIDNMCDLTESYHAETSKVNPYDAEIKAHLESNDNVYAQQLEEHLKQNNPHTDKIEKLYVEFKKASLRSGDILAELTEVEQNSHLVKTLKNLSSDLRTELVKKSINQVESQANSYLQRFFDGEFRLELSSVDESIDVVLKKNGYDCSYTQLSKGQRRLLQLTFSLSVMKAASNKIGVHFDTLFLDEALDGLDSELKTKAFNLLTELSTKHSTVMVIDHFDSFKTLFDKKISVQLINDESVIE